MDKRNEALYAELGELARKLGSTVSTLQQMEAPAMPATASQLPMAAEHLTDVVRLTEQGIHTVMELLEGVQDTRAQALRDLAQVAEGLRVGEPSETVLRKVDSIQQMLTGEQGRMLEMMTALSFQDLVAQRAQKIVIVLEEVQRKLAEMVEAYGPQPEEAPETDGDQAQAVLDQLDATRTQSLSQDYIDDVLRQHGLP